MSAILSFRNGIYWWVFFTAFIFLQGPARDLAKNFRNSNIFTEKSFPFSIAGGLTQWIDDRGTEIVKAFQFNPDAVVLKFNNILLLNGYYIGLLLVGILMIVVIRMYMRAVASPKIDDDIIALVMCFFVYHLVAQTLKAIKVPLGDQLIERRETWVWFLAALIILMALAGRGWADANVFWKGIIELFFVWLFLIPASAAAGFAFLLEMLASFGRALGDTTNITFALVWAIIGFLLAINRLYNAHVGGGGGGHGGGHGGGGGAAAPSLLSRLRRG